jgi:hypothetical protein
MNLKAGDKVVCICDLSGNPDFVHPNGPPPMGPILCVGWAGINKQTGHACVEIIGYPVCNWTKKHLPPREVNYHADAFLKVVPRSERQLVKASLPA